eukprot:UN25661
MITLYQNGFLVGPEREGEFYATSTGPPCNEQQSVVDTNQQMVNQIKQGFVPDVIQQKIMAKIGNNHQGQVKMGIVDKTKEVFTPPFKAFKGHGQSLGGSNKPMVNDFASIPPKEYKPNSNSDTTKIQVCLGRARKIVEINLRATVADLYAHSLTLFKEK